MLVTDKPEDIPSTNALDGIVDPDAESDERAEIYLSGAHVATLKNPPVGGARLILMVELEVTEEAVRFNDNGEEVIDIRRCKRIGDMWRPNESRPLTPQEIKEKQAAEEAAKVAEAAANQPPMFDEAGDPAAADEPEESEEESEPGIERPVDRPGFSDADQ